MKIMYCIAGEGRGHAYRTIPIIEHLKKKGHEIILFAGDTSYPLLQQFGARKISSLRIVYVNNKVSNLLSTIVNFIRVPWHIMSIARLAKAMLAEKPTVLINDFETFSNYLAKLLRIPIITVDNESIISSAKIEFPKKFWLNATKVWLVVKLLSQFADKRIIPTFFYPKLKDKHAILVPPILRNEILSLKPSVKNHILVYQTSKSNKSLIPALRKFNEEFVVYGFGKKSKENNILYRDDKQKFITDLASCNAVITNGGFMLITEAIALKKPVLSLPIIGQFEQVLNGLYLEKLKLGICSFETNEKTIKEFLQTKENIRKNHKIRKHSNKEFYAALDKGIGELIEDDITYLTKCVVF